MTGLTGGLHLAVRIRGGVVREVRLASDRPVDLGRMLAGRPAAAVPEALGRLHALCGRSHRIAARFALAAAAGQPLDAAARHHAAAHLAAERIGEHLRSALLSLAAPSGMATTPAELAALRAALAATGGPVAMDIVQAALVPLGLAYDTPTPGGWAARLLDAVDALGWHEAGPVDRLAAADDAAVIAALDAQGSAFAACPVLRGRRPETGALARGGRAEAAPRDRLAARFAEIAPALRAAGPSRWIADGALRSGLGYAAVETPRGRLHHLAGVDAQGRLERCVVLAPTEWNFHPQGPFVHALAGRRVGTGEQAAMAIRVLVGLFDPCVACMLEVVEQDDA